MNWISDQPMSSSGNVGLVPIARTSLTASRVMQEFHLMLCSSALHHVVANTFHKSGYPWMDSRTSQCCEATLSDCVFAISASSRSLPLSAFCDVLLVNIDAAFILGMTPVITLSFFVFLCLVFCDTSTQGEASQYSPTGGRLRDQKGVLPLPWTVS